MVQTQWSSEKVLFSTTIYYSAYVILSKANHWKVEIDLIGHIQAIELTVWLLLCLSVVILWLVICIDGRVGGRGISNHLWTIVTVIFAQSMSAVNHHKV